MIDRLLVWLGLRRRPAETVAASGRVEVIVDGEPWRPVGTLAGQSADARVYLVRVDGDEATITFGDGVTGRRPPHGARIAATYRHGLGADGFEPGGGVPDTDHEPDPIRAMLALLAELADRLAAAQEQIANEAYLETASGVAVPLAETEHVREAITRERGGRYEVRIRFRPRPDPDPD